MRITPIFLLGLAAASCTAMDDPSQADEAREAAVDQNSPAMATDETNPMTNGQESVEQADYNELSETERFILLQKGTEQGGTGALLGNKAEGTYICRRCNAVLYTSDQKFESNCGWPSFDDDIEGAVRRETDKDGYRTEILCENCDGHLGHVFLGEGYTDKETRHCVNSVSMAFVPTGDPLPPKIEVNADE